MHSWVAANEAGAKTVTVTATELLQLADIDRPTNGQAKECGGILRELFGPPKRIHGRDKWRVPVREPITEDLGVKPDKKTRTIVKQDINNEVF